MSKEKPYQPSEEEIKKAQEMADDVQNERAKEMMMEEQKEKSEERLNRKLELFQHFAEKLKNVKEDQILSVNFKDGKSLIIRYKGIDENNLEIWTCNTIDKEDKEIPLDKKVKKIPLESIKNVHRVIHSDF